MKFGDLKKKKKHFKSPFMALSSCKFMLLLKTFFDCGDVMCLQLHLWRHGV